MMPQNVLSTTMIYDNLIITVSPQPSDLESNELGGVAINDASQGLKVKIWTAKVILSGSGVIPDQVTVEASDVPAFVLFSALAITQISLAFDQNMQPAIAYVTAGTAKLYWYDTTILGFTNITLPVGSATPRITLDDHRPNQVSVSDIILTYILNGNLYMRMQRDRFLVQYILYADIDIAIISPTILWVSMHKNWRLLFAIRGNFNVS